MKDVIDEIDYKCPKCGDELYYISAKYPAKWACRSEKCGYGSEYFYAVMNAKMLNFVSQKVVFDDKEGGIWMQGEMDGDLWLFRYDKGNKCFVTVKKVELTGLLLTNGRHVENVYT